jgi:hypothetical protein
MHWTTTRDGVTWNEWSHCTELWLVGVISGAVCLSLLLPERSAFIRWRRRRAGCCAECGYDLRATPTRCPECGAPPLAMQP